MNKMDTLNATYVSRAELWLLVATAAYFLMNGAQIFETFVLVPKWTAHPPQTLALLTDPNGTSLKTFWIVLHSLHEVIFVITIYFCWKIGPVRNSLLLLFALHFAVRIWTLLYFAPNIISFQQIHAQNLSPVDIVQRVHLWKILNYVRVGAFIAISVGFVRLLAGTFSGRSGITGW